MGVDFRPYLSRVLHDVQMNWYKYIPEAARPPQLKKGKVSIDILFCQAPSIAPGRIFW
jgi:hypothetical protein